MRRALTPIRSKCFTNPALSFIVHALILVRVAMTVNSNKITFRRGNKGRALDISTFTFDPLPCRERGRKSPVHSGAHRADESHAVWIEHFFLLVHHLHLLGFEIFAGDLALLGLELLVEFQLLELLIILLVADVHTLTEGRF